MDQIERIRQMEQMLDQTAAAASQLEAALDQYEQAQEAVRQLSAYYGSEDWKKDYADDEAGLLPSDLKRGVLSEDAAWNVLADCRQLNIRMLEIVAKILQQT